MSNNGFWVVLLLMCSGLFGYIGYNVGGKVVNSPISLANNVISTAEAIVNCPERIKREIEVKTVMVKDKLAERQLKSQMQIIESLKKDLDEAANQAPTVVYVETTGVNEGCPLGSANNLRILYDEINS